jgi:zinc transport system ATP-binding protein
MTVNDARRDEWTSAAARDDRIAGHGGRSAAPGPEFAVRFDAVGFSYGDTPVLENVSFHIHRGEFAALIGPNGSGKTTILRLLLGLAKPSSGTIAVMGKTPENARKSIGYVPQYASFDPAFPISVSEVVRMGRLSGSTRRYEARDRSAVAQALALADVADLADRPYPALSGGQRRRVLVARALAGNPSILILDEPTANMDAESESRLYKTLGDLKGETTILVVTHDTGFVSALTDAVLCVGDRGEKGTRSRSVVRHAAVPVEGGLMPGLLGGKAKRVLHDTELSNHECCHEKENE